MIFHKQRIIASFKCDWTALISIGDIAPAEFVPRKNFKKMTHPYISSKTNLTRMGADVVWMVWACESQQTVVQEELFICCDYLAGVPVKQPHSSGTLVWSQERRNAGKMCPWGLLKFGNNDYKFERMSLIAKSYFTDLTTVSYCMCCI